MEPSDRKTQSPMVPPNDRASTGIDGFDTLIEGGFPRGDLILLAGHPGAGKTIFSAQFLQAGARYGEPGVYVSFAEDHESFLRNMKRTGMDFTKLEAEQLFKFVNLVTVKEQEIEETLSNIIREIDALKAKRLVIDSFSAMAQAFANKIDARILMHTVLGKITRLVGVTTLLISEIELGSKILGAGMEEFVSDGVIMLTQHMLNARLMREMVIFKLRGTNASRIRHNYEITDKGIIVSLQS